MKRLDIGTRIELKPGVRTLTGWTGRGTVVWHTDYGMVKFVKDGGSPFASLALEDQVIVLDDQTPYGMHPDEIEQLAAQTYPFFDVNPDVTIPVKNTSAETAGTAGKPEIS